MAQTVRIPKQGPGKAHAFWMNCIRHKELLIMLLPAVAWYLLFKYYTMYGAVLAFKDYKMLKGILGSPWIGFAHFVRLFRSAQFGIVFRNTALIGAYRLIFAFPAPILMALLLNEMKAMRLKKVVQSITYLPHFMSWVVVASLVRSVLSPTSGIVNVLLQQLGIKPVAFLQQPSMFRSLVIGASIWKEVGWGSVIYLAAITGIDPEIYEAARIDGANRFRQAISITVPMIVPIITIQFILRVGNIMESGFDEIFNLYNPMVYSTGDTLDTYAYRVGIVDFNYSYSTAISLFKNIIGVTLLVMTNMITKRVSDHGIW